MQRRAQQIKFLKIDHVCNIINNENCRNGEAGRAYLPACINATGLMQRCSSHQENMAIARIQPLNAHLNPCVTPADPENKQVYTVWMKSLVFNGHGCTIYGQDGRVAYRVDNYACSRSREVYVMNSGGKTLIKLLKKVYT